MPETRFPKDAPYQLGLATRRNPREMTWEDVRAATKLIQSWSAPVAGDDVVDAKILDEGTLDADASLADEIWPLLRRSAVPCPDGADLAQWIAQVVDTLQAYREHAETSMVAAHSHSPWSHL